MDDLGENVENPDKLLAARGGDGHQSLSGGSSSKGLVTR